MSNILYVASFSSIPGMITEPEIAEIKALHRLARVASSADALISWPEVIITEYKEIKTRPTNYENKFGRFYKK